VGLSEEEIVEIIDVVVGRLGYKFKFGYHTIDDMRQQGRLFAWEGMKNWDGIRPLENFLWTHVRNRLYNFKRNNYSRPEKPCINCPISAYDPKLKESSLGCTAFDKPSDCELYNGWEERNASKRNLMNSVSTLYESASNASYAVDVSNKEILELLDDRMPVSFREDWIRFINNLRLPKVRREKLIEVIMSILEENGIDPETW